MNISGSKKQLKLQLKSGDGKDEELLQEGEVSDLESVTTVRSTESQKTRRAIPKSSPSKRLVEFVTSQGVMTDYVARLIAVTTADPLQMLHETKTDRGWDDLIQGYWFSQNITVVHQENLQVGFWLIEWNISFDKGVDDLFSAVYRVLCVTEVSDLSFKVRSLMIDDSDLEEEFVASDAYFHIAKKGMASHVTVLKMLQDLTTFPKFACLDRSAVLKEESEMTNLRTHRARIRNLVIEATDVEEPSLVTHKGSVQKSLRSSSNSEFMGMAVAIRDSAKIDIRAHNLKTYQLVVNIQPGDSVEERIKNASRILGDFNLQKISISDARKSLELVFQRSGNRQDLLKLAPFDFKYEALFSGSCGTCNTFRDSKSAIHLKDFVTTNLRAIGTEDLSWEVSPELIKSAIFNFVRSIEILSCGSDWTDCFKKFTEWATHYHVDNASIIGPAAYTGPVRLYFARMLFFDIMELLAGATSAPQVSQSEVQDLVTDKISERFTEYGDDIDRLKVLLLWHKDVARRAVQQRIDASVKPAGDRGLNTREDRPPQGGRSGRDRVPRERGADYNKGRYQDRNRDFRRRRSRTRSPKRRRSKSRSRSRSRDKKYGRDRVTSPPRQSDSGTRPCLFEVGFLVLSKGDGKRCTKGSSCKFIHKRTIKEYISHYNGLRRFKKDMEYYNTGDFGKKIIEAVNALK